MLLILVKYRYKGVRYGGFMGEIVKASCKCQRRGMRLGVGMMFYYECDEVMEKARSGRFGRELQEAIEQNFPVVINASR